MIRDIAKLLLLALGGVFMAAAGYGARDEGKHTFAIRVCFSIGYLVSSVACFL